MQVQHRGIPLGSFGDRTLTSLLRVEPPTAWILITPEAGAQCPAGGRRVALQEFLAAYVLTCDRLI